MMKSEVPAAFICGVWKKITRIGIARKPPPMPKIPVIEPITKESGTKAIIGIFFSLRSDIGARSIESPAKIKMIEKPVIMKASERCLATIAPPRFVIKPSDQIDSAILI